MKILIAEDDVSTRLLLHKMLEGAGYEIIEVENGRGALECLSGPNCPRLALLDWLMPGIDGIDVCREIRQQANRPYVYIILLSGQGSKADIVNGLEAGADDYITKPCHPEELRARLRAGERILKLEDKLVHGALYDPLTQLPNRPFFLDRLSGCFRREMRHPDYKFAVLFMDVDRFKVVNDSLGNAAGDTLILQISERLIGSIRHEDTVSRSAGSNGDGARKDGDGILARLGGDKFTILLDHIRDVSDGIHVAERIQRKIQLPFLINGNEVFITASIGIAFSSTRYQAADDMLADAHTAMARAKVLGKSRYEVCDSALHEKAAGRFKLETDLRRASERSEFLAHYQPIVSLADCHIVGFEALVRWQRPGFGLLMPGAFITVAEDTGLILSIGNWVLREACRQVRAWNQQFASDPMFTVAVNISARQFGQADLVNEVDQILRDCPLPPHLLKLELTESVTMRDEKRTTRILCELKSLGLRLCIDDFGTGYSSLSYLRRFPLDILKVDRSFVSEMVTNTECREIVKTIIGLGNNLGMQIVAEGVETVEQVHLLQSLGCQYAQGYFFSKPLDQSKAGLILQTLGSNAYTLPLEAHGQMVSP